MSKHCIECRSEIPDGAMKCVHCNAYQTWRRHIRFSSTFLPLLVALVSVSGLVIPIIGNAIRDRDSNLAAQVISIGEVTGRVRNLTLGADPDTEVLADLSYCMSFSVLVRNTGGAPGIVKEANIWLHSGNRIAASGTFLVPSSEAVVRPDDYRLIDAKIVLTPQIQKMFPARLETKDGRRSFPLDYTKGKVMLHFVRSDGTEWRDEHVQSGRIGQIRFDKESC